MSLAKALDPAGAPEQNTNMSSPVTLETLRQRVRLLERPSARHAGILPFGIAEIDAHLPEHGLPVAALHEVSGGGEDDWPAACATLFVAGILGRLHGTVLWCAGAGDIFAPGLACAGLPPDRVLYAEAGDEKTVFLVMEEALRHPALAAVVGEVSRLPMTASRRLVLAAEKSGVMAVVLHRRREGKPAAQGVTAASTRWCVTPVPSDPLEGPGVGRARWRVELVRCRGGASGAWVMEACDAQGSLGVFADVGDRQVAAA